MPLILRGSRAHSNMINTGYCYWLFKSGCRIDLACVSEGLGATSLPVRQVLEPLDTPIKATRIARRRRGEIPLVMLEHIEGTNARGSPRTQRPAGTSDEVLAWGEGTK